jgi:hypothetical protein
MRRPSLKISGIRAVRLVSVLALALSLSGCIYGFTGGGLPSHIRTVAVLPFENTTPQPLLEAEIQQALQTQLPRDLGVRLVDESVADAVVRGRITRYEETVPSVRPSRGQAQVNVVQRQVRISYEAEIYDFQKDRALWKAASQTVIGNYQPDQEAPLEGTSRAIEELVKKVIEGAQSQW